MKINLYLLCERSGQLFAIRFKSLLKKVFSFSVLKNIHNLENVLVDFIQRKTLAFLQCEFFFQMSTINIYTVNVFILFDTFV